MPAPTISALTPAPNRLDPNFATVADAFLNGFPTLRAEINAFANYLNTTALVSYAFSDGTASQPSLRFASDSNTGLFRPTSDTLAFSSAGSERLRIASDGKVGIGTSSPNALLHVTGAQGTLALFEGTNNSLSGLVAGVAVRAPEYRKAGFLVQDETGAESIFMGRRYGSLDPEFTIEMDGSERLRLDRFGNMGFGTSAPSAKLEAVTNNEGHAAFSAYELTIGGESKIDWKVRNNAGNPSITGRISSKMQSGATGTEAGDLRLHTVYAGAMYERIRINTLGNMGVGEDDPNEKLHVAGDVKIATSDFAGVLHFGGTSDAAKIVSIGSTAANQDLEFHTGSIERVRINSAGSLMVNRTTGGYSGQLAIQKDSGGYVIESHRTGTGLEGHMVFVNGNGVCGTIQSTGSTTSYNTSSDYRLKEDLKDILSPAERLMQLNPISFAWKADGSRTDGFLAHELAEVLPYAVTGEKDAVDADGNPEFQSVDYSKVVPLLTAALQEALNKIENLETRIKAMEGQA